MINNRDLPALREIAPEELDFQRMKTAVHEELIESLDLATLSHITEDQLRDEGFSESEIDELLSVGFFSVMMNMLTDTYDVPWEAPFPP